MLAKKSFGGKAILKARCAHLYEEDEEEYPHNGRKALTPQPLLSSQCMKKHKYVTVTEWAFY